MARDARSSRGVDSARPAGVMGGRCVSGETCQRDRRVAERYSAGDLARPIYDHGADELGTVARALDDSVQQLGGRIEELSRDRAAWRRFSAAWSKACSSSIDRAPAARQSRGAKDAAGRAVSDGTPLSRGHPSSGHRRATDRGTPRGRNRRQELTLARDPGRTLLTRAAPVTGPSGGAVLVLHDITDLRRADQIRRDFVANVSHELRTPLTAIRGYVEALLDGPADAESTRKFLEIIARHSTRMERLVKDPAAGTSRRATGDARDGTLRHQAALQRGNSRSCASIEANSSASPWPLHPRHVRSTAIPAKLHDIVRNLVENAVNYSPEGRSSLSAAQEDSTHTITVADSGPGIPSEDLTRVFERFYRVDKSRARPGGTDWDWRSSNISSSCTAVRRTPRIAPKAAPCSQSNCLLRWRPSR